MPVVLPERFPPKVRVAFLLLNGLSYNRHLHPLYVEDLWEVTMNINMCIFPGSGTEGGEEDGEEDDDEDKPPLGIITEDPVGEESAQKA